MAPSKAIERPASSQPALQTRQATARSPRAGERPAGRERVAQDRLSRRETESLRWQRRVPVRRGPSQQMPYRPGIYLPGHERGFETMLLSDSLLLLPTTEAATIWVDSIVVEPPMDPTQMQPVSVPEQPTTPSALLTAASILRAVLRSLQPRESVAPTAPTTSAQGMGLEFVVDLLSASLTTRAAQIDRVVEVAREQERAQTLLAERRHDEALEVLALARKPDQQVFN